MGFMWAITSFGATKYGGFVSLLWGVGVDGLGVAAIAVAVAVASEGSGAASLGWHAIKKVAIVIVHNANKRAFSRRSPFARASSFARKGCPAMAFRLCLVVV